MPIETSGPDPIPEEVLLQKRSPSVSNAIRILLTRGTANDMREIDAQFGVEAHMTPAEMDAAEYLPVAHCPNFDGISCDLCRGRFRFVHCPECHGNFDPLVHSWDQVDAQKAVARQAASEATAADPVAIVRVDPKKENPPETHPFAHLFGSITTSGF